VDDARSRERIGSALQALAADLVTERRRVLQLRRENRALRAELAALRGQRLDPDDETSEDESDVADFVGCE
jgi:hypothetical protein